MNSRKYNRTYHYPFSLGATNDDRINFDYWDDLQKIKEVVHTEKLDGENTCLNQHGVFARSHAAPTRNPWANFLKEKWSWLRHDLGELEIFGENVYAEHSIRYPNLESHFYVFAVRLHEQWLSWEEVKFYAEMLDFPTVPEIKFENPTSLEVIEKSVLEMVKESSAFGSEDVHTNELCSMEGLVTRNVEAFPVDQFKENVFKYVRPNHVKTDQHWSKNWKRAKLMWERK